MFSDRTARGQARVVRSAPARRMLHYGLHRAPVAQLDRASGFEPEGREFESLRARHSKPSPIIHLRCYFEGTLRTPVSTPERTRFWSVESGTRTRLPNLTTFIRPFLRSCESFPDSTKSTDWPRRS